MEGLIAIVCIQQPVLPEKAKKGCYPTYIHRTRNSYIQSYIIVDQEIACIYRTF